MIKQIKEYAWGFIALGAIWIAIYALYCFDLFGTLSGLLNYTMSMAGMVILGGGKILYLLRKMEKSGAEASVSQPDGITPGSGPA